MGLPLAISALTLYLVFRQVDLAQVRSVFMQVDWRYAALGVLSVIIGIAIKIGRWMLLLREPESNSTKPISFSPGWQPVSSSFLSAQLINNFFPLRVGEVSRVAAVGKSGLGYAFVAGTIAIEKTIDLAAFAVLVGLMLITSPAAGWLSETAYWLAGLGLLLTVGVLLIVSQRERLGGWRPAWVSWLPGGLDSWFFRHARSALSSLNALRRPRQLLVLSGLTALIWVLAWSTNQLALQAFGLKLPWSAALLILVALQVGISLPSLPGRVGVFEYVCVLALNSYGIEPATALSYGILLHVIVYIPLIAGGLPVLWILPVGQAHQPG
jgi:hypothetical protein